MNEDKNLFVERAKMAEQADRYDDMVEAMRRVAGFNEDLSVEERNLLSVAYKNVVGARRSAWRAISNIDEKAESDSTKKRLAGEYQAQIKEELNKWCDQVLTLLSDTLIPNATASSNRESQVFYLKMKGDYYRYLVEVTSDDDDRNKEYRLNSKKAYDEATELGSSLSPANPIRLGLALNFSVFYYEIENSPEEACKIAKESFDNAIAELDNLDQEPYKDCTLIMQLLRDNLTLWTATGADDAQD